MRQCKFSNDFNFSFMVSFAEWPYFENIFLLSTQQTANFCLNKKFTKESSFV